MSISTREQRLASSLTLAAAGCNLHESNKSFQQVKLTRKILLCLGLSACHFFPSFPPNKTTPNFILCKITAEEATHISTVSAIKRNPKRLKRLNLVVH
jgi:hypothetical protein